MRYYFWKALVYAALAIALALVLRGYLDIKDVKEEISALEERVANLQRANEESAFQNTVFAARVRGFQYSWATVVGHEDGEKGYHVTLNSDVEYAGIGPYGATVYTSVPTGSPITLNLLDSEKNAVDMAILDGLKPGDLIVAWFHEGPAAVGDIFSPDIWSIPAAYLSERGFAIAIQNFSGKTTPPLSSQN